MEDKPKDLIEMIGVSQEQLDDVIKNSEYGKQTMQFVQEWTEVTTLSLRANRLIIANCLTPASDGEHIMCRFCGEGIPNWKLENSREHASDCPINTVGEALLAVKKLRSGILGMEKNVKDNPNPLSGRSFK